MSSSDDIDHNKTLLLIYPVKDFRSSHCLSNCIGKVEEQDSDAPSSIGDHQRSQSTRKNQILASERSSFERVSKANSASEQQVATSARAAKIKAIGSSLSWCKKVVNGGVWPATTGAKGCEEGGNNNIKTGGATLASLNKGNQTKTPVADKKRRRFNSKSNAGSIIIHASNNFVDKLTCIIKNTSSTFKGTTSALASEKRHHEQSSNTSGNRTKQEVQRAAKSESGEEEREIVASGEKADIEPRKSGGFPSALRGKQPAANGGRYLIGGLTSWRLAKRCANSVGDKSLPGAIESTAADSEAVQFSASDTKTAPRSLTTSGGGAANAHCEPQTLPQTASERGDPQGVNLKPSEQPQLSELDRLQSATTRATGGSNTTSSSSMATTLSGAAVASVSDTNLDQNNNNSAEASSKNQDQKQPSSSKSSRKSSTSSEKKRRQKEAEKVEKLRLLVSYLKSGPSQQLVSPIALEPDELELAEDYKHHLLSCATSLSGNGAGNGNADYQSRTRNSPGSHPISSWLLRGSISNPEIGSQQRRASDLVGSIDDHFLAVCGTDTADGGSVAGSYSGSSGAGGSVPAGSVAGVSSGAYRQASDYQSSKLFYIDDIERKDSDSSDTNSQLAGCVANQHNQFADGNSCTNNNLYHHYHHNQSEKGSSKAIISSSDAIRDMPTGCRSPKLFLSSTPTIATTVSSNITTTTTTTSGRATMASQASNLDPNLPSISNSRNNSNSNSPGPHLAEHQQQLEASNGQAMPTTSKTSAWTNPQNLATWIDNEVNSLLDDLETKSQLVKNEKQVKSSKRKWLSSSS